MNLKEINKWLDEEYGCSYTKLEELHDFYFEKYCNLKQENKQLKDNWNNLKEYLNEGTFYYKTGNGEYTTEMVSNRINGLDTLRKMQELEQGADK